MSRAHKKTRSFIASLLPESVVLNMGTFWAHSFHKRLPLIGVFVLVGLLTTACPGPVDDSPQAIRVSVVAASDGHALAIEEGLLDLHVADIKIYEALLRIGAIQIATDTEASEWTTPVNANLFSETTLLEAQFSGSHLDSFTLAFPQPSADGVRHGESISIFVEGLIDDTPFEYRDEAMEDIVLSAGHPLDNTHSEFYVVVDLHEWFTPLDGVEVEETSDPEETEEPEEPEEIEEPTGLVVSADGRIYIDGTHNPSYAQAIEAAIRSSIKFSDQLPEPDLDEEQSSESPEIESSESETPEE